MKKFCILVILLTICGFQLYSQRTKDVLYLKDGSVINGTIIEINGDQLKIRTVDNNIYVFKNEVVDKYVKESPAFEGRKKDGFGIALESGFLMGPQDSKYPNPFSFNIIGNLTVNTKHVLGLGTGIEFLGQPFNPIFGEYKFVVNDKKTSPFLFIRGGGLLHLTSRNESTDINQSPYNTPLNYKGGFSATVGTGISWSRDLFETYVSFAYRYAQTTYQEDNYTHVRTTYYNNYNRLEIKLGFKF